jgi:hypothetical protein
MLGQISENTYSIRLGRIYYILMQDCKLSILNIHVWNGIPRRIYVGLGRVSYFVQIVNYVLIG